MSGEADTPRAVIQAARASLALIGDGDWTPQDAMCLRVCDAADALVAALEEAERRVAQSEQVGAWVEMERELNAALAERDVVRDALRIIAALAKEKQYDDFGGGEAATAYERAASIARAALAVSVDEPPSEPA